MTTSEPQSKQLTLHLHYNTVFPPVATLFCLHLPREEEIAEVKISADRQERSAVKVELSLNEETVVHEGNDIDMAHLVCLSLPNCRVLIDSPMKHYSSPSNFLSQVSYWIDLSSKLDQLISSTVASKAPPFGIAVKTLTEIDTYLKNHTFLIDHQLSLADIALYSVMGKLFGFSCLAATEIQCKCVLFNGIF